MHSISQHECNEYAHNRNTANAFQATKEQPSRTVVHAKLEMTTPDSPEEVEAEAAANDIVQGGKIARSIFAGSAGGGMAVSSQMEGRLNSMQGGGQAMPDGLRNMMERGFNHDFSQVRLHTDSEAAGLSSSINAKAFTHGNDIYFNQGQFSPNTSEGQKLMAHELAHVVQGTGKVGRDFDLCEKFDSTKIDVEKAVDEAINWVIIAADIDTVVQIYPTIKDFAQFFIEHKISTKYTFLDIVDIPATLVAITGNICNIKKYYQEREWFKFTMEIANLICNLLTCPPIAKKIAKNWPGLIAIGVCTLYTSGTSLYDIYDRNDKDLLIYNKMDRMGL